MWVWTTSMSRSATTGGGPPPPDPRPAAVGPEAMHRHALALEVGNEGVLPRQDVRDLDVEPIGVDVADGIDQQALGAAAAKALGEPE